MQTVGMSRSFSLRSLSLVLFFIAIFGNNAFAADKENDKLSKLNCSIGQIAKFDGSAWICSEDNDSVNTDTLAGLLCMQGEVARYDGDIWECAAQRPDPPCFDNLERFVDCGNGTVTDSGTGLIFLQNPSCLGFLDWAAANDAAANLAGNGEQCGLTDGSAPGDWHLPTKEEWKLVGERNDERLASGLFTGELSATSIFWSSTTVGLTRATATNVFDDSPFFPLSKNRTVGVWPVRSTH